MPSSNPAVNNTNPNNIDAPQNLSDISMDARGNQQILHPSKYPIIMNHNLFGMHFTIQVKVQ